jgi:hypothetical protein
MLITNWKVFFPVWYCCYRFSGCIMYAGEHIFNVYLYYHYQHFFTLSTGHLNQGCQMVCFQTKNPNLGKFWRVLDWKMFICIIFYGDLGDFMTISYHLYSFGPFFQVLVSCIKRNLATLV